MTSIQRHISRETLHFTAWYRWSEQLGSGRAGNAALDYRRRDAPAPPALRRTLFCFAGPFVLPSMRQLNRFTRERAAASGKDDKGSEAYSVTLLQATSLHLNGLWRW
ncbi:hypothetical protein MRX96_010526 [Rhipicephalus microplus]